MKPRLLDTFCKAGGAGMGYSRAGFEVVGVDHEPQKRYPFAFIQADALEYIAAHGREYDAIHASPPCQAYSAANNIHGRTDHPDLVDIVRGLLEENCGLWVIENVPRSPLKNAALVCGLSLGLNVKRHRLFESNVVLFGTGCERHNAEYLIVFGNQVEVRGHQVGRTAKNGPIMRRRRLPASEGGKAMGIDWMTRDELSQAIPPAYTEYIGRQLLAALAWKETP